MSLSIIAALGNNNEIGFEGSIPWHLREDLIRFKKLTENHTVIMGRKTHESIGKPLPNRRNIVISKNPNYEAPGCIVVNSLEEAISIQAENDEAFIIGGGEIYKEALPMANKMYLTYINGQFPADSYFPQFDQSEWEVIDSSVGRRAEKEPLNYSYITYKRITK